MELYEDWLASGKNWMQSSCVLNVTRNQTQKKRGTWLMKPREWLVSRYGEVATSGIVMQKREAQSKRGINDPVFVMRNPDLPNSEDTYMYM